MNRRRRSLVVVGTTVVLLATAGAVAFTRARHDCGSAVTTRGAAASSSPFLDAAARAQRPDAARDRLVAALDDALPPFGPVAGAFGYHYDQVAHVSAFAQGVGIRLRDDPRLTILDDTSLRPRWSVDVDSARSAYDASASTYLAAPLGGTEAPDLVALDADTGRRRWCATLRGGPVSGDDPFATQLLAGDDVAVLGPAAGDRVQVVRLSGRDGGTGWTRTLRAGAGDFLGDLGGDVLVAGGSDGPALADAERVRRQPGGDVVVGLDARSGRTRWTWEAPRSSDAHVVGTVPGAGLVVLQQASPTLRQGRLFALDRSGRQVWSVTPGRFPFVDATVRSGRVLVRASPEELTAYDVTDGRQLWSRETPTVPQLFPYGFTLGSLPLLDATTVLVPTTTALGTLDLATGDLGREAELPTDGVSTTFWPYEVAVTEHLVAVATNSGAVVVRRDQFH